MLKAYKLFLLCLSALLIVSFNGISANTDTIVFNGKMLYPEHVGKKIAYFHDSTDQMTINDIVSLSENKFKVSTEDIPNLGVQKNSFWIKCTVRNESNDNILFFEIDNPVLDRASFYHLAADGTWKAETITKDSVFDQRSIKSQKLIFAIDIASGQTKSFFMRVQTNSQMALPFKIGIPDEMNERNNNEDILSGIYFGIMLVMFLYNLFIYSTVKDKSYLYYIAYILSVALVQANLKGLAFKYLWPTQPAFEQFQSLRLIRDPDLGVHNHREIEPQQLP